MRERRIVKDAQVRFRAKGASDKGSHIEGHAAVFNQNYVLWDGGNYRVVEIVKPGTFTRALKEKQDVRSLFNHEPDNLLGRTAAGTLVLDQDTVGLAYDCELPDTQVARDVGTLVERKDITGCSFAFTVTKQTTREEKTDGVTIYTREIEDVDLFDVGPVTFPAYEGTDVKARSREMQHELRSAALSLQGLPAEIRARLEREERDGAQDEEQECRCACRACMSAECDECEMHMARCGDQRRCNHLARSLSIHRGDTPTKRVDSEDLTSGCFIYVGDPEKPETWALPWKFKSEEKIKSHLRNALARFDQTQKIPVDKKPAAWKKLVRLCKKYGITVSDEEAKSLGLSVEQRDLLKHALRKTDSGPGSNTKCECECSECQTGNCEDCSNPDYEGEHDGVDDEDGDRAAALDEVDARLRLAGMKPSA
jgi:Escherichia/Staphylococcus phage prohead protease